MQDHDPENPPPKPPPVPVRALSYQPLQRPSPRESSGWKAFKIVATTLLVLVGIVIVGAGILFGACMLLK